MRAVKADSIQVYKNGGVMPHLYDANKSYC